MVKERAAEGSAVVYSTHYMPEVEQLGASVAILERGQVIARGALGELIAQHGSSAVELAFEGAPPPLPFPGVVSNGSLVRIPTPEPTLMVASAIAALGDDARRLQAIEIIRPSLESVYLSLTGHRYTGDGDEGGDDTDIDVEEIGEHVLAH